MSEQTFVNGYVPHRVNATLRLASARFMRLWPWFAAAGIALFFIAWAVALEVRSSELQSAVAVPEARKMTFDIRDGAGRTISFPTGGPYDARLGYSAMPQFVSGLSSRHYFISRQARQSAELSRFIRYQGYGLYDEKHHAGLALTDRDGAPLYVANYPERSYDTFGAVPPLVAATLAFVEDRQLLDPRYPHYNPAVEWKRFALACVGELFGRLDPHLRAGGASTLATQIEKFRHSPNGRTIGPVEKLKQMAAATLRAYMGGEDTLPARQQLVATYLDSTPLGSRPGYGEIIGVGDGLRVWYGTDFNEANRLLADDSSDLQNRALAYKQMLSLLLAERRPTYYLGENHDALALLTNRYLRALSARRVISPSLRDAALASDLTFTPKAPAPAPVSFLGLKATDAIRTELMQTLHVPGFYNLDHLDLSADTTIDSAAQKRVMEFLGQLHDPDQVENLGLVAKDLLGGGDPADVNYSVVLYERGPGVNYVRVHADSLNEPFDINSGTKLQLGSTAKLRTLVTYLDIVDQLHARYAQGNRRDLEKASMAAQDPLTSWATDWLAHTDDRSLQGMLDAAMQRKYSASPGESFFTGSGMHVFHNFEKSEDYEKPTVADAIVRSINLSFIRIMRDIERYYVAQGQLEVRAIQRDADLRATYLRRFADQEGRTYLTRFYKELKPLSPDQRFKRLAQHTGPYAVRQVIVYRSVRPNASLGEVSAFLTHQLGHHYKLERPLSYVYDKYAADKFSLTDRGYLTRVHPLELWLTQYLDNHPDASRREAIVASTSTRQDVYGWLFKSRSAFKQDVRIKILVEQDAFKRIWQDWHRQGYPFSRLVPSLATAIGSSGDRPDALADLMGILVNGGVRQPTVDIDRLHFAAGTPYDTEMKPAPAQGERVLAPEIASTIRHALGEVMVEGTGKHFENAYRSPDGSLLSVGGKTGTGDNRFDVFAGGNRLIESRVVDRTATFMFFLGDRHFGTVTAYVPGKKAGQFHFTSALAVQILERLTPEIEPLLQRDWREASLQ